TMDSPATAVDGPAAAMDSPAAVTTAGTVPAGDGVRQRLGVAQAAVLSSLVAGTPVPEGFDRARMGVQARALAAKRAGVVAKVAPELPAILGDGYRAAFLAYARSLPMSGGYRRDALDFAGHLLKLGRPDDPGSRRELREWWLHRAGPAPRPRGLAARARVLLRRS
ncbi:endonuclease, partial [Streptomyces sp. NPDC004014]